MQPDGVDSNVSTSTLNDPALDLFPEGFNNIFPVLSPLSNYPEFNLSASTTSNYNGNNTTDSGNGNLNLSINGSIGKSTVNLQGVLQNIISNFNSTSSVSAVSTAMIVSELQKIQNSIETLNVLLSVQQSIPTSVPDLPPSRIPVNEQGPMGMSLLDGSFVCCNAGYAKLLGYELEDAMKVKSAHDFMHPAVRALARSGGSEMMKFSIGVLETPCVKLHKNGKAMYCTVLVELTPTHFYGRISHVYDYIPDFIQSALNEYERNGQTVHN